MTSYSELPVSFGICAQHKWTNTQTHIQNSCYVWGSTGPSWDTGLFHWATQTREGKLSNLHSRHTQQAESYSYKRLLLPQEQIIWTAWIKSASSYKCISNHLTWELPCSHHFQSHTTRSPGSCSGDLTQWEPRGAWRTALRAPSPEGTWLCSLDLLQQHWGAADAPQSLRVSEVKEQIETWLQQHQWSQNGLRCSTETSEQPEWNL